MVRLIPEGLDFTIRLLFVLRCSITTLIQHAWIQVPEFDTDPFFRQAYVSLAQIWPIDNLPNPHSLSSHVFTCMFALSIGNIFWTCMGTFISHVLCRYLQSNYLSGLIPAELGNLLELEILWVIHSINICRLFVCEFTFFWVTCWYRLHHIFYCPENFY